MQSSTHPYDLFRLNVKELLPRKIFRRDVSNLRAEANDWETHMSALRASTFEAIAARRAVRRDYKKVHAEAERWKKQMQTALKNNRQDLASKALFHITACQERERVLKALIDRYTSQVSHLKSQLKFWESQ
jgi:phage shock protein A